MGDSRSNPGIFANIINVMEKNEPDLIISMGDLVANGGNLSEWQTFYFDVASNVIDHIPLVSTLGDHEGENDNGTLFGYFFRADQTFDKLWFSFDYGNAHFVDVVISGDTLKLKAVRNDGSLLDKLSIIKEGDAYNPGYTALIQSQESVSLLTGFTNALSSALNYVPFKSYIAPHIITLKSCVNEDIPFRIELTENSAKSYKMDAFSGILEPQGEMQVPLRIQSKVDFITISGWGAMSPELRLKMVYTYGSKEETIVGGKVNYWPSVY